MQKNLGYACGQQYRKFSRKPVPPKKKNNQHAKRKSFVLILIIIKSQRDKVGCWGGGNSFPSNNYVH